MVSSFSRAGLLPAAVLLAFAVGAVPPAHAVEERVWVSIEGGVAAFDPETSLKDAPSYGVHGGYFFNRWVGVDGVFTTSSPNLEQPALGSGSFSHFGGGLILTPDRHGWVLPYLYAGLGSAKAENVNGSKSYGAVHGGGGVVVRSGERFGFRLDARDVSYSQEGGPGRDTRVHDLVLSAGVTALWGGRPRDTDEDGVPDKRDQSPATPRGAVVAANGAPLDGDGDGVFDGLDQQPTTPSGAVVDAQGVSIDSDKDGVPDGIDKCADTVTGVVVDATGCGVDSDGDKVFDGLDKCAGTPAGSVVDAGGCPVDEDGDGIPDGIDICPNTTLGVAVNAGGCPIELTPMERTFLQDWLIRFSAFPFAPDSATFSPEGAARLDSVGVMLSQWPSLKVEIGVHCDDTPEPGFRVPLTSLRARAVLRYLLAKYPKLSQKSIWITGYGDTDPIAPNTSTAGRLLNSRVDIKLLNMHVLTAERERRASFGSTPAPPAPGLTPRTPEAPQGN
ncbi:MAG TPA: OmpA family protein [Candidatus Eisenbacteria bacterium]|nr:OmpA family protein [Candidatus Eisenbacteria bacterium]